MKHTISNGGACFEKNLSHKNQPCAENPSAGRKPVPTRRRAVLLRAAPRAVAPRLHRLRAAPRPVRARDPRMSSGM